uniref:Ribulose bisphosphate carboxylase small subunit, chloroplastic 3 n=1 Tax=Acetabularia peniculus TaxID=35862 RepID=RBS3_ACEPE|nr:RecName: Full=Ribulose bisphosphate carboxylase small subunit, chloroplastic 3; Short=RuBisCO small subunit 3; Flags: Precursor [Acetabularia peniculus]CAA36105.1 ribulose bisphosphate carboxylase, small subunit precursor [Acetabularia peniculus]
MATTMLNRSVIVNKEVAKTPNFPRATKNNKGFASNAAVQKCRDMMVWQPFNNKMFETFSYLPPLTDEQISKQVDYILANSWTPCLEFAASDQAYAGNENCIRMGPVSSTYQDNRYWTMWKLPMFGCTDGSQVLSEIQACTKAFPDAYIRLVCFDANRQVQISGFLVHRPPSATDYRLPADRQV